MLTGDFTRGTVGRLSGFRRVRQPAICRDRRPEPRGGPASASRGTGTFAATLTHYRTEIFGQCLTYSASVTGSAVAGLILTTRPMSSSPGGEADGTARAGHGAATEHQIDVNAGHAQALRDALARHARAARRGGARPARGGREDTGERGRRHGSPPAGKAQDIEAKHRRPAAR